MCSCAKGRVANRPQDAILPHRSGLEGLMKSRGLKVGFLVACIPALLVLNGCSRVQADTTAEAATAASMAVAIKVAADIRQAASARRTV